VGFAPLVPVTGIGGYLGAGKTTLIDRVLADPGSIVRTSAGPSAW
jgi:G3E family GTPase